MVDLQALPRKSLSTSAGAEMMALTAQIPPLPVLQKGGANMLNPVAQLLWVAAQKRGGSIMLNDVSESDIAHGRANGWLTSAGIGHFKATEELRKAAAYFVGTTDAYPTHCASTAVGTTTPA
jgi:hypothetical protein